MHTDNGVMVFLLYYCTYTIAVKKKSNRDERGLERNLKRRGKRQGDKRE